MDQPRTSQSQDDTSAATPPTASTVLFREIHKNAWLKRLPASDKKSTGAVPKKGERVWVVFCVHDDAEPFLEVYLDQKVAVMHKPDWFVPLNNCLHISPTICAQEDEYEFVVTLSTEVVRFTAPSWELMMEWVDTIRSKLREMRILSPRENLYTRMPEARLPLAPTRDPNSPLPPPPAGPSTFVPGVEPVHSESSDSTSGSANNSTDSSSSDEHTPAPAQPVSLQIRAATTSLYITQSEPPVYTRPHQVLSRAASVPDSSPAFLMPQESSQDENVTVIEVAPMDYQGVFNFNFIENSLPSTSTFHENLDFREENEAFFTPPATPANDAASSYYECVFLPNMAAQSPHSPASPAKRSNAPVDSPVRSNGTAAAVPRVSHSCTESTAAAVPRASHSSTESTAAVVPRASHSCTESTSAIVPRASLSSTESTAAAVPRALHSCTESTAAIVPRASHSCTESTAAAVQRASLSSTESTAHHARRRRSSSNSENTPSPSGPSHVTRRVAAPRPELERRLQPAPHPYRQVQQVTPGGSVEVLGSGRLTLREQQVLQLRREMLHPGGVRLQLRRKDCTGSIALVDAFGAVWITGWKQREHPMLYNALHIGDQLLSVASIMVQSAVDAQKLIRGATSLYVEFVIRRVPFGRVFAIRREVEGQSLGITQEGNTAEIRDVVPGGLAACHGLSPRAQTCDGLSLTNWVITEINGRPLNLFFKDGEVRDRLNAVGKEISILVQPFDLVKQLKKQLKALRGYKEYIVQ